MEINKVRQLPIKIEARVYDDDSSASPEMCYIQVTGLPEGLVEEGPFFNYEMANDYIAGLIGRAFVTNVVELEVWDERPIKGRS